MVLFLSEFGDVKKAFRKDFMRGHMCFFSPSEDQSGMEENTVRLLVLCVLLVYCSAQGYYFGISGMRSVPIKNYVCLLVEI